MRTSKKVSARGVCVLLRESMRCRVLCIQSVDVECSECCIKIGVNVDCEIATVAAVRLLLLWPGVLLRESMRCGVLCMQSVDVECSECCIKIGVNDCEIAAAVAAARLYCSSFDRATAQSSVDDWLDCTKPSISSEQATRLRTRALGGSTLHITMGVREDSMTGLEFWRSIKF